MSEPATLHRRIYAELEGRILSGDWAPGSRIPFEHELTAQYGCSRMTVNKAISELAGRGLVTRRRRAGTFVAQPRAHAAILAIPDLGAEIAERGQIYGFRLLDRLEREPRNREERDLAAGGVLLELAGLHLADDAPFALERRLIALAAAPEAATADFSIMPPGAWLLDSAPWTEAEHRISAIGAAGGDARLLGLKPGTACLCVDRRTWRDGQGVTQVRQTFPGDRYDLVARFSPARGDRP
ncbi:histidine utilization repressor [Brevundimonas goettingensis]|uniref:Histidine utilization repressor n=1 Tax=Brevundimonas goettingensis TaxID=2774190 RepID=A0A975BZX4_9CAUL|nr:histidine utilization repressor [Brevundimonas goettingensis]QTC89674.1 histidine utilization repressor [Brevundimonas goettingensis]